MDQSKPIEDNSFGNQSSPIQPEEVRAVRKLTSNRKKPFSEKDF